MPNGTEIGQLFDKLRGERSRHRYWRAEKARCVSDRELRCSGCSLDFHDRQVFPTFVETNFQGQPCTRASSHQRPRLGARRTTLPPVARFEPRTTIGWELTFVRLVGRAAAKPRMGAIRVVPVSDLGELAKKCLASIRYEQQMAE